MTLKDQPFYKDFINNLVISKGFTSEEAEEAAHSIYKPREHELPEKTGEELEVFFNTVKDDMYQYLVNLKGE